MTPIIYLILAIIITMAVFLLFQAIGGKILGATIDEIGIFVSPTITKFKIFGLNFSLNLLPFGTYVKFTDSFENLSPIRKILIVLSGLLSYSVVAILCLGFSETLSQTISFYGQFLQGIWSPITVGSKYVADLAKILTENSFLKGLGILSAKMLGSNLLPFGVLAGGQIILHLLEIIGFKSEKFREKYQLISLFIWLPLFLLWTLAIFVFFFRTLF